MSVPNRQIGWSQESNLLWGLIKQFEKLIAVTYKSFTRRPVSNTLVVDCVYGNDEKAADDKYAIPFLTINAAIDNSISGDLILVHSGIYDEIITLPENVCLRGSSVQCTVIRQLNVTSPTTLVTMGVNSRIEDVTLTLTSAEDVDLIGVDLPNNTSTTAKLRTLVINVTSTASGSCNVIGLNSAGTSPTAYSSSNITRSITINVIASGLGIKRGVLILGENRTAIRDTNIYARGTASDIVGFEVDNALAIGEIKTSTIAGILYDVNRKQGQLIIGSTDLLNNNANGNSFTPSQAPANFQYGIINNLATDRRYYLLPGTVSALSITSEIKANPYDPSLGFPIAFVQPSTIIDLLITFTATLGVGEAVTFNIYKNNELTPSLTLTLNEGEGLIKTLTTESLALSSGDTIKTTLETTGSPANDGAMSAMIGYY